MLLQSRSHLARCIDDRAAELCRAVMQRRTALIKELEREHASCAGLYAQGKDRLRDEGRGLADALEFIERVFPKTAVLEFDEALATKSSLQPNRQPNLQSSLQPNHQPRLQSSLQPNLQSNSQSPDQLTFNLLHIHNEVISHLNRLVNQSDALKSERVDILSLKLDVPGRGAGRGREDGGMERLFGSLVRGSVGRPAPVSLHDRWSAPGQLHSSRHALGISSSAARLGRFAAEGKGQHLSYYL